ncbi:MAG: hypothetical protein ICV83_11325, partial [Cytophagales bacterium]|nr:hypothetical protein [Cytophagales bacterium]
MHSRPPESLKRVAAHVAGMITTGQSGDSQDLIRQVLDYARKNTEDQYRVGVWQAETIHSEVHYVRDVQLESEWSLWANVHTIPPKTEARRVAFLGESAARGFLYDPGYTPAQVLEEWINGMQDALEGEVIDLARTNQGIHELVETLLASLVLEPDALVIFAGNNWLSPSLLTRADVGLLSEQLDASGNAGAVRQLLEKKIEDMVGRLLRYVADLSAIGGIPAVMVIPEYNLVDTRSTDHEKVLSRLAKEDLLSWLAAKESAEEALAKADFEEAAAQARRLVSIDASHPTGYELLGQCLLSQGFTREARKNLEAARDTALCLRSVSKPRILTVIRDTILAQAPGLGIAVVDLQTEFDRYAGGKLPGKELFLDYCHLTARGMQVAMKATADRLLPLLGGRPGAGTS